MATRLVIPTVDVGPGIKPASGAKMFFFSTGTNAPRDTFTTAAADIPNANPVISDSNGVFPDIFINGIYKVILTDKNDVQVGFGEADPVGPDTIFSITKKPTESITLTASQTTVAFTSINVSKAEIFLTSLSGDRGRLFAGTDFTVTSASVIELTNSQPAGTICFADETLLETATFSESDLVKKFATLSLAAADTKLKVDDVINLTERTTGNGGGAIWDVVLTSSVTPNTFNIVISTGDALLSLVLRDNGIANALQFGAIPDGTTDSTLVFDAMFDSGLKKLLFPSGSYRGKISETSTTNVDCVFEEGASIQSFSTDQVIKLDTCTNVNILGGSFSAPSRVSRTINLTDCNNCDVKDTKVSFATKSTFSGSAPNSNAGIFLERAIRCLIENNEVFNIEGYGVTIADTGNDNTVRGNNVHDNIGGIFNNGDNNNFNTFINNDVRFNNVSPGEGNDGIYINATSIALASSGHSVSNNRVNNSGEHGLYIQSANTNVSDNIVNSNAEAGIKLAKCRNTEVVDNVVFDNQSNIQVQSGYEQILIQGNTCRLATGSFDLDFTWSTGLDPFGGKDVKVIGNYFLSDTASFSMDIDGTEGVHIENNTCKKGLIYTGNATPVDYLNVTIKNNTFLDGIIRVVKTKGAVISDNKAVSLFFNDSNSEAILRDNVFTALTIATRKDLQLEAFKSICGNEITSPDIAGAPNFELFNGQEAVLDKVRICGNTIITAGAIIFNINTLGGLTDSVISNNIFDAGGTDVINMITNSDGNALVGNVGLVGTITTTNSTGVANTGGTSFSGAGSSFANNI
jgi:parallel beta-helix repeat protein